MRALLPQSVSDRMTVDAELMLNSLELYLPQDLLYEDIIHKSQFVEDSKLTSRPTSAGSLTPSDDSTFDSQTEEPLSLYQSLSQNLSDAQTEEKHLSPSATELPLPPNSWTKLPSWYIQPHEERVQVHGGALEALQNLTDLVSQGHLRREDLMVHEITAQLYPLIPSDHEGKVTSLGSILHAEGVCNPCAFFQKNRCHKKDLCTYCHFEHDIDKTKKQVARKGLSKRKRMRLAHQKH